MSPADDSRLRPAPRAEAKADAPPTASLRRRLLSSLAIQLYRHPFLALAALVAVTVAGGWSASRLEVQENLRAQAAPSNVVQRAWDLVRLPSIQNDPVIVVVRLRDDEPAPDATERERLTKLLTGALSDPSRVAYVEPAEAPAASLPPLSYDQMLVRLRPFDLEALARAADPDEARRTADAAAERAAAAALSASRGAAAKSAAQLQPSDPFGLLADLAGRVPPHGGPLPPGLGEVSGIAADPHTIVLRVGPLDGPSALFYSVQLHTFLRGTMTALLARDDAGLQGARVEFHGRHVDTARRAAAFGPNLVRVGSVLLVCLALLVLLAFRKAEALLFVGLPPAIGLVWTYGLAATFTDSIGLLTALYPILLLALGLEFTLQIYHRFTEELYREQRYYPALGTAYTEAGRGVIVTTIMAAAIFLSLSLRKYHDLREMALVSCAGVLAMALAPLLLLPPMAAVKSRLARGAVSPVDTYDFGLNSLSAALTGAPRAVLALGLVVTVYLAFFTGQARLNHAIGLDLGAAPANTWDIGRQPDPPGGEAVLSVLVEAPTLDEALAKNDRLYENVRRLPGDMRLAAVASVSSVLPAASTQEAVFESLDRIDVPRIEAALRAVAASRGLPDDTFSPFVATLIGLQKYARTAEPVVLDAGTAPAVTKLAQKYIFHIGSIYRILTAIVPARDSADLLTHRFSAFWRRVSAGFAPGASPLGDSEALQNLRVASTVVYTMAVTVLASFAWLLIAIVPHFRARGRDLLLCLIPLACAGIWTLGFLVQFRRAGGADQPTIGLSGLLMFPLVLAVAANQTILFIQRLHDRQYASPRQVVRAGGRPGIVSMLMIALGMGSLVQLPLLALREMATVGLMGVVFCTIGILVFVPALVQVREEGGVFAWPAEETE